MSLHKGFIQVEKDERKNEDSSTKKFNQIGKDEEKKNQESFHQRKNVQ